MDTVDMEIERTDDVSPDPLPFARNYQLEALENGIKQNTIVFLETGSGKTLVAIMLLRSYAYLLRKPSPFVAVFLVPKVVLVAQQAAALEAHTDLKVGTYWGEKGVDNWDNDMWKEEIEKYEVLVMTPQIFLNNLRHSFFKLSMIKVLVLDECHHARGNHPYACIMTEFYHRQLCSGETNLPRILGMTASPVKSKGGKSEIDYWELIRELEILMNSKVYTCASESVVAEFIPFSTPKFKFYRHEEIPYACFAHLADKLKSLQHKHELSLVKLDLDASAAESISKKLMKVYNALIFCLDELGVWLAMKAAHSFSCNEVDFFPWGQVDVFGEAVVKKFSLDAFQAFSTYIPTNPNWSIADDAKSNMDEGLLTAKVVCLIELLLEYRDVNDLRCIVFVERIVTAVVIQSLLSEFLSKYIKWKTKYIAGSNHMQSQTRKKQNEIVGEFREGMVNIIVATSILEEGLDVQSCNLVVRFDPSSTVCSFIQSRGRARKQNSDYVLMVKSGDVGTQSRLKTYLASGDIMRKESLGHASLSCVPLESDLQEGYFYCVESTGAIVTLSSSISLLYFYCSRLPADGYFKPTPRWDKDTGTIHLPKSCPIQAVSATGNVKTLKQIACLEACKKLHEIGALTDNLVPDMVVEEDSAKALVSQPYEDDQPRYVPSQMVGSFCPTDAKIVYHCYFIELKQDFEYKVPIHNLVLGTRSELESDIASIQFNLQVGRGIVRVTLKYAGTIYLDQKQVMWSRRLQVIVLRVLLDQKFGNLGEVLDRIHLSETMEIDYLLLPAASINQRSMIIDWDSVVAALFSSGEFCQDHKVCKLPKAHSCHVHTKSGVVCICMIRNSLVYTPHNGNVYCITDILYALNGNSGLNLRGGGVVTYKKYFEVRYGINLQFSNEPLLKGQRIFQAKNYLLCREAREKESSNDTVELPPELCFIIMSPISLSTLYSFSFFPSIMHHLESLLIAANLKRLHLDHCMHNIIIPTIKVLEAITTKKCQETVHLESLETLGDSFLKYAVSQHLFKTYQNNHEGLLSLKKDKIISNAALSKLGCEHKLPGFIRDEFFEPKKWIIPGDNSTNNKLQEDLLPNMKKIYISGARKMKSKRVADVVEALIGAFLSTGGEIAALKFMNWIGIEVEFSCKPYERHFHVQPEKLVNIRHMESLLNNYSFHDPSLLVEALTHGSYMLPEIPTCYQRLEFLGDAVLDYIITLYLYNTYPGMSPGLLTDMRSASVNNDCYAVSAVKAGLHKHILHTSHQLHKEIVATINDFKKLSLESTFGWETESSFPKVLGDVIESLGGAIFVDSGYNKEIVFQSIRPLLEPLITPETVKLHPAKELSELCQKRHYNMQKVKSSKNGISSVTIKVVANGETYEHTSSVRDKTIAKKVACKEVLKSLKQALNVK